MLMLCLRGLVKGGTQRESLLQLKDNEDWRMQRKMMR
jgi:hypothetical protein